MERDGVEEKLAQDAFAQIVRLVQTNPTTPEMEATREVKLQLYGLYKHVTCGPCKDGAPSAFNIVARAKYESWRSYSDWTKEEAQLRYMEICASQSHWIGEKCSAILEEYKHSAADSENREPREGSSTDAPTTRDHKQSQHQHSRQGQRGEIITMDDPESDEVLSIHPDNNKVNEPGFLEACFGFKPLVPRGELDISWTDLAFATFQCAWQSNTVCRFSELERGIVNLIGKETGAAAGIVGLSVRSLLDLYLRCATYPHGSQVVITPAINIPGMMEVLRFHGLEAVGVDLPRVDDSKRPTIGVDVAGVREVISASTVAILVVHAFGMISASDGTMATLSKIAETEGLELWEDCAECFTDTKGYLGSPHSHISLFSFGTIKRCTALGGAVAILRSPAATSRIDQMRRMQLSMYEHQSKTRYFLKILRCVVMKGFSSSPVLYGILLLLCRWTMIDFDWLVTSTMRSFPSSRKGRIDLVQHLRYRPCTPLLTLLMRRLRQKASIRRIQQGGTMVRSLMECHAVSIPKPPKGCRHTFWLFPVSMPDPSIARRSLLKQGFDASTGSSQLQCVGIRKTCPKTFMLMETILYIPVNGHDEHKTQLRPLIEQAARNTSRSATNQSQSASCLPRMMIIGVLVVASSGRSSSLALVFCAVVITVTAMTAVGYLLRFFIADLYLTTTNAFSRHAELLKTPSILPATKTTKLDEIVSLVVSKRDANQQEGVLLTGATGFLGSLLLRDLLLHRSDLGVDFVVVLCRPSKKGESAALRIERMLERPMFSFLRVEERGELVRVVQGDVSKKDGGLSPMDKVKLCEEWNVIRVFHCAASVSFTQSLGDAANANITSSLVMQRLTRELRNKSARYIHLSTAFVHGITKGTATEPLPQSLVPLTPYSAADIYYSMLGSQLIASKAMKRLGFVNSYTFSKAVCEHLLLHDNRGDTIILRPSIIGPSWAAPSRGWAGEKPSTLVAAAGLYMTFQWSIWCFGRSKVPAIPVDVVSRFILKKAFESEAFTLPDQKNVSPQSSDDESFEKVSLHSHTCPSASSPSDGNSLKHKIFNVAWDSCCGPISSFTWIKYAVAVTQVGSVVGFFARTTAFFGLLVSCKVLPSWRVSDETLKLVHQTAVLSPIAAFLSCMRWLGLDGWRSYRSMNRLKSYIDLPILFLPFMNNDFHFRSELLPPESFDGSAYMFSCVTAAQRFLSRVNPSGRRDANVDALLIGGKNHLTTSSDAWWAWTQPRGNIFVRLAGWIAIKLLRLTNDNVTVDVPSFSSVAEVQEKLNKGAIVVLCPTHRSFFDFILISFLTFALPELGVDIPYIAAAEEFADLCFFGWFSRMAQAFFVRRGSGVDEDLRRDIARIKSREASPCFELFIEGTRSRDRRFIRAKTGLLRHLIANGEKPCILVPIAISYERLPEQAVLVGEKIRGARCPLSSRGALSWAFEAIGGKIRLGTTHISAGQSIVVDGVPQNFDVRGLGQEIQRRQMGAIVYTEYHIRASTIATGVSHGVLQRAFRRLGLRKIGCPQTSMSSNSVLSPTEAWMIFLQIGHALAPTIPASHAAWALWLDPTGCYKDQEASTDPDVLLVIKKMLLTFDAASAAASQAIDHLAKNGFPDPKLCHVIQQVRDTEKEMIPAVVIRAAVALEVNGGINADNDPVVAKSPDRNDHPLMFNDIALCSSLEEDRVLGRWGFKDSRFVVEEGRSGRWSVAMSGSRYRIGGRQLHQLVPFIEVETQTKLNMTTERLCSAKVPLLDESAISDGDLRKLRSTVSNLSVLDVDRCLGGTCQSQDDICRLRLGIMDGVRMPDVVVRPSTVDEVEDMVSLARSENWCIVPVGGGTNVSNATRCPPTSIEERPIVALDTRRLNRILWINEEDGLALVEAGITGRRLAEELSKSGYTTGHEPDSYEFSTLGGWIATKASGMKRSKYGNIEDIVKKINVVGAEGIAVSNEAPGRVSQGIDLCSIYLGSEGCLGVITSAIVRVWPLPKCVEFEAVLLPKFDDGIQFMRDVSRLGSQVPASVRVLDNDTFRLGQALREDESVFHTAVKMVAKSLNRGLRTMTVQEMVCATVVLEGSKSDVREQRQSVRKISSAHGGVMVGPRIGRAGYELTFVVAYLRDFALSFNFLGDSFETFVPWSKVDAVIRSTRKRIKEEHERRCLPGRPFIGGRLTQAYHEGVCVYFYVCMCIESVENASQVFHDIEYSARQEIINQGGSISHHHGVGKLRAPLLRDVQPDAHRNALLAVKEALDPTNVFGARNGSFAK